ncbi:MAG: SCO1664 family protein [Actinobacteria bacterium]|nr:SCO1664 family protein [Actinomycetota bacterium]
MPAPDSTEPTPELVEQEALLLAAELHVVGRMPWSSNATLLCELREPGAGEDADPLGRAIYKPHRGERPLWDFPDGLYRREVATYRLARALGWDLVPPTVERDGPFGVGSVQWFVDADFDRHYFELLEDDATHDQLRRMAAFDVVANSTDRKGGHVLADEAGHLWGIDNGLSFHAEFKLRTVIWDFGGEPLPAELAEDLDRIACGLPRDLADLLDPFERNALATRARALLAEGRLPVDPTGRRYPWPLV